MHHPRLSSSIVMGCQKESMLRSFNMSFPCYIVSGCSHDISCSLLMCHSQRDFLWPKVRISTMKLMTTPNLSISDKLTSKQQFPEWNPMNVKLAFIVVTKRYVFICLISMSAHMWSRHHVRFAPQKYAALAHQYSITYLVQSPWRRPEIWKLSCRFPCWHRLKASKLR